MAGYHPKKRLGQNFLISDHITDKIVSLACRDSNPDVIEVGPGQGALTVRLADSARSVTAVEFDRDLIQALGRRLSGKKNVSIINDDFLRMIPDPAQFGSFVLVGNLPYNITSPVLDWCVRFRNQIERVVIMVQKELADRVTAVPGGRDWSPLSIFTQLYFDASIAFEVPPSAFKPEPKVMSAVVELTGRDFEPDVDMSAFSSLVRAAFKQRRKQLVNNLVPDIVADSDAARNLLARADLAPDCRAEQVTTEQFFKLTRLLASDIIH